MKRREFLGVAAGAAAVRGGSVRALTGSGQSPGPGSPAFDETRASWVRLLSRVAAPVLDHLAAGTLRSSMPVEQAEGADRSRVTHLEAVGRLLSGLSPWLELEGLAGDEAQLQARLRSQVLRGLTSALDPSSSDVLNFTHESQPLVDAAFLSQAVLRAPRVLGGGLDQTTRARLVEALQSTRAISPGFNNWLLFSATVEAALKALGAPWDRMRVDYALRQHEQWYRGDGMYSDGPSFHWDYYNSFVIHPLLLDVLAECGEESAAWKDLRPREAERARRYAAIQERLIAPDGSFPAIGRSIAYRCGAFHLLAQAALKGLLPESLQPAQVRGALSGVIRRTLLAPGTFDPQGWLTIGLAGHQPQLGERYISTGSLYLCATAFLPLGLEPSHAFWTGAAQLSTSQRAWSGQAVASDHALD